MFERLIIRQKVDYWRSWTISTYKMKRYPNNSLEQVSSKPDINLISTFQIRNKMKTIKLYFIIFAP